VVTAAEIAIDADVILDGEGALTVHGARDHRVFSVPEGVRAELRGVVVAGGLAPLGGGIWNAGVLTLMNSVVSGSSAAEGGGIHNVKAGTMTLLNTTVFANDASLGGGIFNDGTLTATHSIVSANTSEAGGGGIFNERELSLMDSSVSDNTAGGSGGGISNVPGGDGNDGPGRLTLLKSIVSGNTASFNGGGINSEGTATLTSSTVSANRGASGGGVYVRGDFTVVSGTVSGNVSESCGGGIDNDGTVSLANTTISGNRAVDCGGGIYNQTVLTVTSSTFSDNAAARGGALGSDVDEKRGATSLANTLIDGDCDSDVPLISNGYNIESPGDTCGLDEAAGDMVGVTAEQLDLGPLQDNGGFVQTHAITTDSAAFDVIPESMCQLEEDEREVTRPQGDACDVGAFELEM
jgi:predicted outer membrane repeat protein